MFISFIQLSLRKIDFMATANITGFRIPEETLSKAKYIVWFERETLTERVLALLEADIAQWEEKNGVITPELAAKAVKPAKK